MPPPPTANIGYTAYIRVVLGVILIAFFVGVGGVPPSAVRAEGVAFAVGALQGTHGGRNREVIGELR